MGEPLPEINLGHIHADITDILKRLNEDDIKIVLNEDKMMAIQILGEEFPFLAKNFPTLFDMVIMEGKNFDFNMLYLMMKHYDMVRKGQMSMELANKQVATIGHNRYIQPVMDLTDTKKEVEKYKKEHPEGVRTLKK